ncbi:MAG: flagellar motor switch protein FliG [Rhodobacteraceae bacterium]|nr:flagellar motor switch protein FliG [Paracoccaceae bacterium]
MPLALGGPPDGNDATPPATPPPGKALRRRAKAAVVVRLLLNEGADVPLADLPDDLQVLLTEQMGAMGLVDRATLLSVVHEFAEELDGVGLAFPRGIAGALSALDGKINPATAARLRKEAGVRQSGDPWVRIRATDVADLAKLAEAESTEVAAVMLSKLDTTKAASLLGLLPGPHARRITYAVSLTESISPEAVDRIGLALASQIDARPIPAFPSAPVDRVGAILNFSRASTRDDVLSGLDETDADFARLVRKKLFTFAHIPARVQARDVPRVVREVPQQVMIPALAFALATPGDDQEAAEFILANMTSRAADALREEIAEAGRVKAAEADSAKNEIVTVVRTLQEAGDIILLQPDEEEDGG